MTSVGKLTAAIVSGSQELTVALASLSFDFSLFKVEAPAEYKAVGAALSPQRRAVAEDGDIHGTARKLRALFERTLPATPHLYKAYGTRASEIANSGTVNPKGNREHGAFANHVGLDGASLWAAATSGSGAIAIHLLACMLARLWTAAEATSIWQEIVAERKAQIAKSDDQDPMAAFSQMAARSPLSRQELADWDASARAWLRAADDAFRSKQAQLRLIIDNINIPVNLATDVYESVHRAWTTAMVTMDRLVAGMPHSVQDGSVILGLSAWHLYPDMSVLGKTTKEVKQNDLLVATSGILTLGLERAAPKVMEREESSDGVYWSLPLSYLRYYGDAIRAEKTLGADGSRITIAQLQQLALGSLFNGSGCNTLEAAEFMASLWSQVKIVQEDPGQKNIMTPPSSSSWLGVLSQAAQAFVESTGLSREENNRLVNYGRRRGRSFLGFQDAQAAQMLSIFRLREPEILLDLTWNFEERISILRQISKKLDVNSASLIIRYIVPAIPGTRKESVAYAMACPDIECGDISGPTASENPKSPYKRWQETLQDHFTEHNSLGQVRYEKEECVVYDLDDILGPVKSGPGTRFFWSNAPLQFHKIGYAVVEVDALFGKFAEFALFRGKVEKGKPRVLKGVPFELVFGDPATAAIYKVMKPIKETEIALNRYKAQREGQSTDKLSDKQELDIFDTKEDIIRPNIFSLAEVKEALETKKIRPPALLEHLAGVKGSTADDLDTSRLKSLRALATAVKLYQGLEGASIHVGVTASSLDSAKWMPLSQADDRKRGNLGIDPRTFSAANSSVFSRKVFEMYEPVSLDRASTFACIAMFETGNNGISPVGLEGVMAMSIGDSLYITSRLLCDPCQEDEESGALLKRVRGNIGRAGIAMMIPPQSPKVREPTTGLWNAINHLPFDGAVSDCFQSTSLHLSFTEYSLAIDVGHRGMRDTEVFFLETIISVHDKGEWVADLDILPIFRNPLFRPVRHTCCNHDTSHCGQGVDLTIVDNWEEFIDRPDGDAVVRAHGNWLARLAAATVSVTKGQLTIIFDRKLCWQCGWMERERFRHKAEVNFFI